MIALFFLLHVCGLGVFFFPFRWEYVALLVATYALRMFAVTAGYHRYFAHRSYKMARGTQFLMAFVAQTSAQKGVLWWASHHRHHHRYSDQENDVHSPWTRSFWWSHVGWVISNAWDEYDPKAVADFAKYPELRWLDRHNWVPPTLFAAAILAAWGWGAFFWGFVLSTILLYHGTFAINSFAHVFGTQRFETGDQSKNNFWLALITLGEGWHNNHHWSVGSCRQGYRWWEIDVTYYVLRAMSWVGLTWDLRPFREKRAS